MQLQRPDVHAEMQRGITALRRSDFPTARDAFAQVVGAPDAPAQAWLFYAQGCAGCRDWERSLHALNRVAEVDPQNPFVMLMKADIFAEKGDDRAAVSFYRAAIRRCAQLQQMPGDLPQRLQRATAMLARLEQRFEEWLRAHLADEGLAQVPPRVSEALAIASDRQPIYLQQPTSFYFPGLPQQAWYSPEQFPWVAKLEAAVPEMRAEIERVLAGEQGLEPYVQEHSERASQGHSLLNDASWSAFHLWKNGKPVEENASRCPLIMRLLELPPIPRIAGRSPMALISILKPGTHIAPHTGMLNTRLICHIPLVVPDGCRLRVGGETRQVVEGKAMIFDDSIEHEAWNNSDAVRAVLLFEIWRPELSDEERIALSAMFEAASGYNPPSGD